MQVDDNSKLIRGAKIRNGRGPLIEGLIVLQVDDNSKLIRGAKIIGNGRGPLIEGLLSLKQAAETMGRKNAYDWRTRRH
jgi:hypothetical protein